MPTDKKKPLKGKSSSASGGGLKQTASVYSKKTALLEEAITQMNAGKYGRSSSALKELLAMDPHNMEARRLFATLHLRLGSLIPARQAFDSLIDEAFTRQDYWLAESLLREYLAAGPRCVPYLEKLGVIYQDKGEVNEAVEQYGKAIDILIEDPDSDNPDHASHLYKKIKDLAPVSGVATRVARYFDVQTGALIAQPLSEAESDSVGSEEGFEEGSEVSLDSEPVAEIGRWGQIEEPLPVEETDAAVQDPEPSLQ
ncbi:MAG: tetratricopeptide repeat protein, partial [Nitrospira sp.]|nr:tetratricopeptide repeat protein [Nitrospira sp.]